MFCLVLCGPKTPLVHQASFGSKFQMGSTTISKAIAASKGLQYHFKKSCLLPSDLLAICKMRFKPHIGWEHDVMVSDVWQCVVVSTRWGGRNVLQMACIMTRYESHKSVSIEHCLWLWFGSSLLLPWSWLVDACCICCSILTARSAKLGSLTQVI